MIEPLHLIYATFGEWTDASSHECSRKRELHRRPPSRSDLMNDAGSEPVQVLGAGRAQGSRGAQARRA
jgi:hypothetical protein